MSNRNNKKRRGQGLKLSGQGCPQKGKGWMRNIGVGLSSIGAISMVGAIKESNIDQAVGSAIFGGLGSFLIYLDKKNANMSGGSISVLHNKVFMHLKKFLKKHPQHMTGTGKRISHKHIKDFLEKHKDRKIHIKDIFGHDYKSKGKELMDLIEKAREMHGGNIFQKIGKAGQKLGKSIKTTAKRTRDAAHNKLKQFVAGKTRFKPSDLLSYTAAAVGLVGSASALIPGIDLISVPIASGLSLGLKSTALALKTSGKGLALSGGNVEKLPYGVTKTGRGKIKRDRYSVFHGYYPKLPSGLTKTDFMLKGKRVISKRKHLVGKKLMQDGKGLFKIKS